MTLHMRERMAAASSETELTAVRPAVWKWVVVCGRQIAPTAPGACLPALGCLKSEGLLAVLPQSERAAILLGDHMKTVSLEQEINPWEAQSARFDLPRRNSTLMKGSGRSCVIPTAN
jgi:hypothetical protein